MTYQDNDEEYPSLQVNESYNEYLERYSKENEVEDISDPVWSILPSYDMHTRTLARSVNVEEHATLLPDYSNSELDSSYPIAPTYTGASLSNFASSSDNNDGVTISTAQTSVSSLTSQENLLRSFENDDNFIITDEDAHTWTETVISNIHNLRNLTFSDNKMASAIKIDIFFTTEVGEIHKKPTFIDPSLYEYKRGDFINGYIMIRNESDVPIPFEMFYVLFEGNFIVANPKDVNDTKPVFIKKFLEMYDFSASYDETNVDRLISEYREPYTCPRLIDSIDDACLSINPGKLLKPHFKYKRFFTFKIPERLLDSECKDHDLSWHTELPPSLGISRDVMLQSGKKDSFKDFAITNSSTSYSMSARFIGKASQYNAVLADTKRNGKDKTLINSFGDEFVILKENFTPMRILQHNKRKTPFERKMKNDEIKLMYNNLISRIQEKIEIGHEMIESINNNKIENTLELSTKLEKCNQQDLLKNRQLYRRTSTDEKSSYSGSSAGKGESYELLVPFCNKKSILSQSRNQTLGTLKVSFPKKEIQLRYVPPPRFQTKENCDPSSWQVKLPINLEFTSSSIINKLNSKRLPDIKDIMVDLVVFTFQSPKYDLPVEFNHDTLFKNEFTGFLKDFFHDTDNFTHIVKNNFRKQASEMYKIFKILGSENFKVEKSLIDDLKAVCEVEERYFNLKIDDFKIENFSSVDSFSRSNWSYNSKEESYRKEMNLLINTESAILKSLNVNHNMKTYKSYNEFCLVPSFQTCRLGRAYYYRVMITLSNNETFQFKVPVTIEKY